MAGVLKIDIHESLEDLKELLSKQSRAIARSQVQILWWLKSGQATQVNELVRLSGYHRTTVSGWLSQYRQGGLTQLLARGQSPGRPRAIAGDLRAHLVRELDTPEGFASYGEVQRWLAAVHGCEVPYKTVHKTVRYDLKAKLKVPRPVSEKQAPGAVAAFQQTSEA